MKKLLALLIALSALFSFALADNSGDYYPVDSSSCLIYSPEYGIAVTELPEALADNDNSHLINVVFSDDALNVVALCDGYIFLKEGCTYDTASSEDITAVVVTSVGIVGMEGDISEETAREMLDTLITGSENMEQLTRLDGHNAFMVSCNAYSTGDESVLTARQQEILSAGADNHAALYQNIVNIPRTFAAGKGSTLAFSTTDLDGNSWNAQDVFAREELTLLNVWATWCNPCVNELADLQKLNDTCDGLQVVLLCDNLLSLEDEEKLAEAKAILEEKGVSLICLVSSSEIEALLQLAAYPTSYLLNQEGVVVAEPIEGSRSTEDYQSWVEENR